MNQPNPLPEQPLANPHTDLALETFDTRSPLDGIHVETEQGAGFVVTRVEVQTETGAQQIGKPPGNYVTIEAPGLRSRNQEVGEKVSAQLALELTRLLDLAEDDPVFVVGLGNWRATPDALGPRVLEQILVTRHLHEFVPSDLRGGLRPVCALTPGVLGITGIETGEIIKGIVDRVRPKTVIAVDALAARSLDRIITTIQIADTGIHPGSGVGNHRIGITEQSLGVKVIAIGVPTVVHAMTIANNVIDLLQAKLGNQLQAAGIAGNLPEEQRHRLINEAISPALGNLMVTPKEIDVFIQEMAGIIAAGINRALHPELQDSPLYMELQR